MKRQEMTQRKYEKETATHVSANLVIVFDHLQHVLNVVLVQLVLFLDATERYRIKYIYIYIYMCVCVCVCVFVSVCICVCL